MSVRCFWWRTVLFIPSLCQDNHHRPDCTTSHQNPPILILYWYFAQKELSEVVDVDHLVKLVRYTCDHLLEIRLRVGI